MPLKIKCPQGHELTVPAQRAGKHVRCPICMETFLIEGNGAASDSETPTAPKKSLSQPSKSKPSKTRPSKSKPSKTKAASKKPATSAATKVKSNVASPSSPSKPKATTRVNQARPKKTVKGAGKDKIVITSKDVKQASPVDPIARASDALAEEKPEQKAKSTSKPVSGRAKAVPKKQDSNKKQEKPKPESSSAKKKKKNDRRQKEDAAAAKPKSVPEPEPEPTSQPVTEQVVKQPPPQPATPKPAAALQTIEEPGESDEEKVHGVEHDPAKLWVAYTLAIALAVIGILNFVPAIFEFVRSNDPTQAAIPIQRWSYVLLCVGAVQLFYAIYLSQLPDWGTVWVVAILTLIISTGYAMLFGIILLGKDDSAIIHLLALPQHLRDEARLWCFSMLSATGLLTYFCGREGIRWHKVYQMQSDVSGSGASSN